MWISRYVCVFMLYSFFGWVYETLFCTVKGGRWENRGFLYGPVCPIYGAGSVILLLLLGLTRGAGVDLQVWQLFLISVAGSAVLEYVTSWGLEKLFHARWWDYSDLPLNLHGRVSLFPSLGFGAAALLIAYVLAPVTERWMDAVAPPVTELLALLLVAVFAVDLTLTVTALLHFDRAVIRIESAFNKNMENLVENTVQKASGLRSGLSARQKKLVERLNAMSGFVKSTVRRVSAFRSGDEKKDDALASALRTWKKKKH